MRIVEQVVGTAAWERGADGDGGAVTDQITSRMDFPKPVANLEQGKVWLVDDIENWIGAHRPQLSAACSEYVPKSSDD
ncbi:DNA-binding protein [Krasilnikovia sp. MM14-A1004]|uniref:DNA-binding protein n=1 Tax=Krasilnikovia sp. MM14-A1004 TaxID=3373541 RepID=UPI00399CEE2A